ncbi:RHS repeat domain-containing protein, partial [Polluticaenibacter yanchengensis]|nr:hypothetical protein [Chitinophagaceae bacterium LY-5]
FWLDNILVEEVEDGGDGDGSLESNGYRYGFNGKEKDNDVKGDGNQQDYGMRIYDGRLGRFLSVDPITMSYPMLTPYQFASNRPTKAIDLDGLEAVDVGTGRQIAAFGQFSLGHIAEKDYSPWRDLLTMHTCSNILAMANNRNSQMGSPRFKNQEISKAYSDQLNLDYYSVKIIKLPPSFKSSSELFAFIKSEFATFIDKNNGGASLSGWRDWEQKIFNSSNPESSVMKFKIYPIRSFLSLDDANVITTKFSLNDKYWVFKPITDNTLNPLGSDGMHPVSGQRQFGLTSNDNDKTFTFYTRGVDRPWSAFDAMMSGATFKGADALWKNVMKNVVDKINKMGGWAYVGASVSKQISWENDVSNEDKTKVKNEGN